MKPPQHSGGWDSGHIHHSTLISEINNNIVEGKEGEGGREVERGTPGLQTMDLNYTLARFVISS